MVKTEVIIQVYTPDPERDFRQKKQHIYNNDVLGYYWKVPERARPVFVVKAHYLRKNFSMSLYSSSIITTFPLAVYNGFSHCIKWFNSNFISSCSRLLPYFMDMFFAMERQR